LCVVVVVFDETTTKRRSEVAVGCGAPTSTQVFANLVVGDHTVHLLQLRTTDLLRNRGYFFFVYLLRLRTTASLRNRGYFFFVHHACSWFSTE
jgi:hypothetical protein